MRFSSLATVVGSTKLPSAPGSEKSTSAFRSVAERTRSRPAFVRARWPSMTAVSVAPRQSDAMLTCFAPVISSITSSALSGPSFR